MKTLLLASVLALLAGCDHTQLSQLPLDTAAGSMAPRLSQADGETMVEQLYENGRILGFALDATPDPIEFQFVPTASHQLETYALGPGFWPRLVFDDQRDTIEARGVGGETLTFTRE